MESLFETAADRTAVTRPRAARNTDPSSSHQAARDHTDSGKRATHAELVYKQVCKLWPQSFREIAAALQRKGHDISSTEVMRRLNDLHQAGKVRKTQNPHWCTKSERNVTGWMPVNA